MKSGIASFLIAVVLAMIGTLSAQDSRFRPDRQQIPTPGCLVMKGAWEGGSTALPCSRSSSSARPIPKLS